MPSKCSRVCVGPVAGSACTVSSSKAHRQSINWDPRRPISPKLNNWKLHRTLHMKGDDEDRPQTTPRNHPVPAAHPDTHTHTYANTPPTIPWMKSLCPAACNSRPAAHHPPLLRDARSLSVPLQPAQLYTPNARRPPCALLLAAGAAHRTS